METFNIIAMIISIVSLIIAILSVYYTIKTKKRYEKLAVKLGNGENISDILKKYISQVNELDKKEDEIIKYCNNLNSELNKCIKKVGLIKYNLYNTNKNNLSFALALLDNENNGIVINSVYGIDNSNVYCKLIIKGEAKNKLSEEENEALKIAINK